MGNVLTHLQLVEVESSSRYKMDDARAWQAARCPSCGSTQMVVLAVQIRTPTGGTPAQPARWYRCPACYAPAVDFEGTVYPSTRPLRTPLGVPPVDATIWEEARSCLGVGANAAAVMLCRKLLFHIAVGHGLPAKKANGYAPGYMEAVEHLETEGLITKKMRPWVDRIKDVGNDANHELTPIPADVARDVATFTEQLLVLAYELDALRNGPTEPEDAAEDPEG